MPRSAGFTPRSRSPSEGRTPAVRLPNMITSMASAPAARPSTESAAEPAIQAEGVCHAYGSRQALVDLSIDIAAGELFAVLGPNGGGKTTLFRLLSTLIPIQRGSVRVFGRDLTSQAH